MTKFACATIWLVVLAFVGRQDGPIRVPYTEVGSRIQILGRLGQPLGTYLVLDGVRFGNSTGPTMMGGGNYRVTSVNGKALKAKVELWISEIKNLPAGRRCKVEGYETGGMIGIPYEVERKTGAARRQAAWQFQVEFVTVKTSG